MSLLPGGEHGSPVRQLLFAFIVISGGYQTLLNIHRVHAINENISSLGEELNLQGEDGYRNELLDTLDMNSVPMRAEDISIAHDEVAGSYVVTVPCWWTLDLGFWKYEKSWTVTTSVKKRDLSGEE